MRLRYTLLTVAALGVAIAGGAALRDRSRGRKDDAEVEKSAADVAVKATQVTVTDTTYKHDTTKFHHVLELTDTMRAHLVITDTSSVRRVLAQDASALLSCQDVVRSCEARVAARDQLIASLQREVTAVKEVAARPPPRLSGAAALGTNPLATVPVPQLSARVDLRILGAWSLEARGDYRLAPGERPGALVFLSRSF